MSPASLVHTYTLAVLLLRFESLTLLLSRTGHLHLVAKGQRVRVWTRQRSHRSWQILASRSCEKNSGAGVNFSTKRPEVSCIVRSIVRNDVHANSHS
jgi:hypothetical protein